MPITIFKKYKATSDLGLLLQALGIATFLVTILSLVFFPQWETNDDLVMSMIAHGYGLASQGGPNIFFSNIIWGHLVRLIPEINGVLGYSIATAGVLIITATTLLYGLMKLGFDILTSLALLVLIFLRPVLFPQFTINSGLLMVASIISIYLYSQEKKWPWLIASCLLAYCSYLIRAQEAILIFLVSLPLLPWRFFLAHRTPKIALALLMPLVVISATINDRAYQDDSWNAFMALNPVREQFTDWGVGENLKQRPDLLKKYGYSENDIELVTRWFFVDHNIANPSTLKSMIGELHALSNFSDSLVNATKGLKTFLLSPALAPLVLAGIVLAIVIPSWEVGLAWCLSLGAAAAIGFLGRPGVERIYIPLASLLFIAPLLIQNRKHQPLKKGLDRFVLTMLCCATLANTYVVINQNKWAANNANSLSKGLAGFPSATVVAWGIAFPYEAAYPVYRQSSLTKSFHFYGLNVFSLAPFSNTIKSNSAESFTDLLLSKQGIPIIATEQNFSNLALYCSEHYQGKLLRMESIPYGQISIFPSRCAVDR